MISDEKMNHIVHLVLNAIDKAGMVTFPKTKDAAVREARKTANLYIKAMNQVADVARARILSQKNPPQEGTTQWDTLYAKYYEEELRKRGA